MLDSHLHKKQMYRLAQSRSICSRADSGTAEKTARFETLRKEFHLRERGVTAIGEMVHDADLNDGKFGRKEAFGVDEVLKGFARKGMPDKELLERGIEMIEGLYHSVQ